MTEVEYLLSRKDEATTKANEAFRKGDNLMATFFTNAAEGFDRRLKKVEDVNKEHKDDCK